MHKHIATSVAVCAALLFAAPSTHAQVTDPTDLHMGVAGQTGSDPVLLNNATSFGVSDVPSGQAKDAFNLELIIAVPVFGTTAPIAPTIGTLTTTMPGVMATAGTEVNVTTSLEGGNLLFGTGSTAKDLYSYLVPPCSICDNSLNMSNLEGIGPPPGPFTTLFTAAQLATLDGFDVYTIPISFNNAGSDLLANQTLTTTNDGLSLGSYVAALAFESDGVTPLATSFTNTGLVNVPPGTTRCVNCQADIPEPSSLAVLGGTLLALAGVLGWRRSRRTLGVLAA